MFEPLGSFKTPGFCSHCFQDVGGQVTIWGTGTAPEEEIWIPGCEPEAG